VPAVIRSIGTELPPFVVDQTQVRDRFLAQPGLGRLGRRLVGAAFDGSAVERRHTVLAELATEAAGRFVGPDGVFGSPSTGFRNDRYRELAPALFVGAARRAVERADLDPATVTHLVTVSCTGFTQPGPDLAIVQQLGLRPTVFRHHVGFMGCAAVFPALRVAAAFVEADPSAVVLVVAAELCSLHLRATEAPDQIVANSVFSDGGSAAVVAADGPGLRLEAFSTTVIADGEADMAWNIGDEGFEMVLSTRVPKLVQEHVREALAPVLGSVRLTVDDVGAWAVHPGGRAILDRVGDELALVDDALDDSRAVLRDTGNMSSATILFVLDRVMQRAATGAPVIATAFGPGLTVESAALRMVS
jgi:predicted naringenin-chalcone synthase